MRRAILAVTGMVAGTTLLISLKSAPGASRLPAQVAADEAAAARAAALASASAGPLASGGPGGGAAGAPATGAPPAGTQSGQPPAGQATGAPAGQPAQGQQQPRPGSTTQAPAAPPAQPKPPASAGTFTGDSSYTEFGYVTVAIKVSGGKITDVIAVELPENEPRSVSLSAKAAPTLRQRALAAQSSTIDSVSGATYTSEGYKSSLQSALDKAGLG